MRTKPTTGQLPAREVGAHGKTLELRWVKPSAPVIIHAHSRPTKTFEKPAGMVPYVDPKPSRDRSLIGKARTKARKAVER